MDFITSKPTIDQAELKKILFNRPVSVFQKPSVGIVAGKYAKLPVLNELYEVLTTFGLDPLIVADEQNKSLALLNVSSPERSIFSSFNKSSWVRAMLGASALRITKYFLLNSWLVVVPES